MTSTKTIPFFLFLSLMLLSCNLFSNIQLDTAATVTSAPSQTPLVLTTTPSPEPATPTSAVTETETIVPTVTETAAPTPTETPAISPTPAILRGQINVEKAACRYGPGPDYLYLYGLRQGANQDIIGRTDTGTWLLTRSRGDNKACWVNAQLLTITGDVMSVEMVYPDKFKLLRSSQVYRFPYDVAAVRSGDTVNIEWKSDERRPGDEESASSVLYMVETWVCKNGKLVFTPIGTYTPQASVTDEAGCAEPSHGRVYFVEKHGYTGPSEIPWPAP